MNNELKIGDVVTPANSGYSLSNGADRYPYAVVVNTDPLILVSREADMRWEATVQRTKFKVIGSCDGEDLDRCITRLVV